MTILKGLINTLGITFDRNHTSWSNLKSSNIEVGEFTYELDENNVNIDILTFQEVYSDNNPSPMDAFNSTKLLSQIFAIEDKSGFFIINTQGYNYARSIAKLEE